MKTNDGEVGKEGGSGGSRQSSKKWALGVGERWQTRGGGGEGGWRGLVSGGEVKKKKKEKKSNEEGNGRKRITTGSRVLPSFLWILHVDYCSLILSHTTKHAPRQQTWLYSRTPLCQSRQNCSDKWLHASFFLLPRRRHSKQGSPTVLCAISNKAPN